MQEIRDAMEGAGVSEEQMRETERRLLEMANPAPEVAGAATAFAQVLDGDGDQARRVPAAERARRRKQRKRERQARRRGRR